MKILGINLSHCSSVALILNSKLVYFQEEERLSRVRRQKGWPHMALSYMLDLFNFKEEDIDLCVVCDLQSSKNINLKIKAKKITYIHHHLAHIFSGYALNPAANFIGVSIDGGGDYNSWMSIARFRNRKLINWFSNCGYSFQKNKIKKPFFPKCYHKPLGTYWSHPCVLNFGMLDKNGIGGYEGKLMGLSANGNYKNFIDTYNVRFSLYKKNNYFFIKTDGPTKLGNKDHVKLKDGTLISLKDVKKLRKLEKKILFEYDLKNEKDLKYASNFASLLQNNTEDIVLELFEKNNFDKEELVMLSGGLFSNVLLNGKLNQKYNIFVVPTMGDEGLAIGAAAWGSYSNNINLQPPKNLYLGFESKNNDNVDFDLIGRLLNENKIVGFIEGKMEAGPRALGGRSILANPSWKGVNQTINQKLNRVEYMPFAPVILEEHAAEILENWNINHESSKHMTLVYKVKDEWKDLINGVVHTDGTVRPQIINLDTNPNYYKVVKSFFKYSKIPVLINTSFNLHGEPILENSKRALEILEKSQIDVLVADNKIYFNKKSS